MTDRPPARKRLDPEVRRQQIIEAAARVFATEDPDQVSFEAVADAAGVSRSLVYSYFRDRGSLFAATYTHELRHLDAEIDDAIADITNDRERLGRAVGAYLRFAHRHRDAWEVIAAAGSSRHPAVRQAAAARTDRIAAILGGSNEARLLVSGIVGMLEAAAVHTLDDTAGDPDELAALLTQVIWTGVSPLVRDDAEAGPGDPRR